MKNVTEYQNMYLQNTLLLDLLFESEGENLAILYNVIAL